jgi:hypothetical protein
LSVKLLLGATIAGVGFNDELADRGTSLANLAAVLGVKEVDLAVDWGRHLSDAEK